MSQLNATLSRKPSGWHPAPNDTVACGADRSHLRRLDACLKALEDANERSERVVSAQLAKRLQTHVPAIWPGMMIADALELVFFEQSGQSERMQPDRYVATGNFGPPAHLKSAQRTVSLAVTKSTSRAASDEIVAAEPLSRGEARTLTDRIKERSSDLSLLVLQAHEGRAWSALGYRTWEQYVRTEFGLSRSRSYELVDHGRVLKEVRSAAKMSAIADISPYDARRLKPRLAEIVETIRGDVALASNPELAAEIVNAAVSEALDEGGRARAPLGNRGSTSSETPGDTQQQRHQPTDQPTWYSPHADTDADMRRLYSAIDYFASMPDPVEVIERLRLRDVNRLTSLSRAVAWLLAFDQAWNSAGSSVASDVKRPAQSRAPRAVA